MSTPIILGSGELFLGYVADVATATESDIEAAITKVGEIQGGATLYYEPKFKEVRGGKLNGVLANFKTQEEVRFSSGLLTWDMQNLSNIFPAVFSEDTTLGTKRVGIGGISDTPVNYLRFIHQKPDGKKITMNVYKAQNQNGFEFSLDPENETVIDLEFKALAVSGKEDGNLVEIVEEV